MQTTIPEITTHHAKSTTRRQLAKWAGLLAVATGLASCAAPAGRTGTEQRTDVHLMARQTLNELCAAKPQARRQIDHCAGYAVLNRIDTKIMAVGSGNGYGIAIDRHSGRETYLRMAGLSAGLGAGVKNSRTVMIFRRPASFRKFVTSGWSVGANANADAALDNSGIGLDAKIDPATDPLIYQMTRSGVALSATLGGEKVWPDRSLNH